MKLTVTSSNGCTTSTTQDITLVDKTVDFTLANPAKGCLGLEIGFTGSYSDSGNDPVVNWDWTFEDGSEAGSGQNVSHTYNTPGEYTVELKITTTKGCIITETKTDRVKAIQKPIVSNVTYPVNECRSEGLEFTAEFSNGTDALSWDFSNGPYEVSNFEKGITSKSIPHFFTAASDNHTLTVTAYDDVCASDPYGVTGIAVHQPIAAFSVNKTRVCAVPETLTFTNLSVSDDSGTTYSWDFGDKKGAESTSTLENPTHKYTSAGNYLVSLSVANPVTGCTDVAKRWIYVRTSAPDFVSDKTTACHPAEITFTNEILVNSSDNFTIKSVAWDFDNDGSFDSNEANPSYSYTTPDSYTVKMKVTEQHGCVYTKEKSGFLSINGPVVSFLKAPDEACTGNEITFKNATSKDDDDPANISNYRYAWDFGDGESSALESPVHTYSSENSFKVTLEVTDEAVIGNIISNDTDLGDAPVKVDSNTDPANGTVVVNPDGTYTYTPHKDFFGTDSFDYTIEDVDGEQATATVTITVNTINDTPVAVDDTNTTNEDVAVNGNVLSNDTGLGDVPVKVVSNTNPTNGKVVVNPDGTYTYTPNTDFFGVDSFDYTIEDVDGEQSTATVTITVNATDDTPLAVDDNLFVKEDDSVSGNIFDNDEKLVDIPVVVVGNTDPSNGTLVLNPDGSFTYTPKPGYYGNDSFTYTLRDNDGDESTATVRILVDPLDYNPVAKDDADNIKEDETSSGDLFDNDEDFINPPVVIVSNTDPANGSVVVNSNGTYTYTPNKDFFGTDTFTYTLEDGDGDKDTATVTITVIPENDTPVAVNDTNSTNEDEGASGNVLANDTDLGDAPVTVVTNTNPANGTVVVNADGTYTYTPVTDFFGIDSFEYVIEDEDGEQATATVTITVNTVNDTPVAVDDSNITDEDTAVNGSVLDNDTDLGDVPVRIVGNTDPSDGTLVINSAGIYTYDPNENFNGTDRFTYTIEDVDGEQSTAKVTITVNPINDVPVAVADTDSTNENEPVSGNVLPNDSEIDEDKLTVVEVNGDTGLIGTDIVMSGGGVLTLNADGTYVFNPNGQYDYLNTGEMVDESFTYQLNDGNANSNVVTVVITVIGVNDAPVAEDDHVNTSDNEEIIISVLDNDFDVDEDPLTVSIVSDPSFGKVVVNEDGSISYIADLGAYCQSDEFTYRICDPEGLCDEATVSIDIDVKDSDEDSIPDALETLTADTDEDATPDYLDLDSDNDGVSDEEESQITDSCKDLPVDTDEDGTPDYRDLDSDGDGFSDEEEGNDDCDGDGTPDYSDAYDDCGEYVSIPEGFSPNGDGTNDFFVIKGIKDFPNSKLIIFNRWGSIIYEAEGYQNDWDARAENSMTVGTEIVPEGTYYYIIDLGNGSKPVKGFVYINY